MQLQDSSFKLDEPKASLNPIETVQTWLITQLSKQLSLDPNTIKITEPLTRYGLDSIDAVTLVGDLEDWLDMELPDTLFWDHATIEKAAQYLGENYDLAEALNNINSDEITPSMANNKTSESIDNNGKDQKKGWGNLLSRFK
ncbi:phosphopantetheine-binding [Rippkaea orientalis PCC 8801]|uniref:Phosphopantetheine-binding n=1 Tax=Rippkaea orientalis (strain PCC 8801 / RF-1) TaxID=41431 RepID=B7JZH6_RIPO1|nr:acyl carrier protein [Rippkaea orientalis]ACK64136.1 phosphopantetheine-binding [Rippkaea orientalis PCC 8801]